MNTIVWLIRYTFNGKNRSVAHTHNAIEDYRGLDPAATVQQFDAAAVTELLAAAREAQQDAAALGMTTKRLTTAIAACAGAS